MKRELETERKHVVNDISDTHFIIVKIVGSFLKEQPRSPLTVALVNDMPTISGIIYSSLFHTLLFVFLKTTCLSPLSMLKNLGRILSRFQIQIPRVPPPLILNWNFIVFFIKLLVFFNFNFLLFLSFSHRHFIKHHHSHPS